MRKKAFSEYTSIYEIASRMKDTDGDLLSPERGIFSALCNVLSIPDNDRKLELLGKDAYDFAERCYAELNNGLEAFIDVFPEACGMTWTIKNGEEVPFQEWGADEQLRHMKRELDGYIKNSREKRLVAAKTRRKYFPVTEEYLELQGMNESTGNWLTRGLKYTI